MTCAGRPGRGARAPRRAARTSSTVSTMQTSGTSSICGAYWNASWPSLEHRRPTPASAAACRRRGTRGRRRSTTTEAPLSAPTVSSIGPRWGRMWRRTIVQAADARGDRRLHERAAPQRERLAEHQPRRPGPVEHRDHDHEAGDAGAEDRRQGEARDGGRDAQEDVGDAHQDLLDPAAVEAGDDADDRAQRHRREVGDERELQRLPAAPRGPREHVAADLVGAERVPGVPTPTRQPVGPRPSA